MLHNGYPIDSAAAEQWQLFDVALSAAEERRQGDRRAAWIRAYLETNYGDPPEWTTDETVWTIVQRLNDLTTAGETGIESRIVRARKHSIHTPSNHPKVATSWPVSYLDDL